MSERLHIDSPADKESFFFEWPIPSLVKSVTMKRAGGSEFRIKPYLTCNERPPSMEGALPDLSNRLGMQLLLSRQNSFACEVMCISEKFVFCPSGLLNK